MERSDGKIRWKYLSDGKVNGKKMRESICCWFELPCMPVLSINCAEH